MDEPYNLKLHLPFTSIHTLKVVIRPLVIAVEYFVYDYDYRTCKLENNDLLEAISPKGHYTLKIETDSKTYISKRQCGKITENNCDDVAAGTEDNFLIWIKCKELIQCLVTANEPCEDFELIE
ncbi:Succinate-semialdehyde dehydrogenase [Mucor velutinosus]|uniref:Succinate-semialdehyde dehydrogenase n=1 Tax=Mucor velutinosus TaxID=708070 RepID=A0AAN7DAP6_9FUNG|nr:Succinate-semialdehyde dehydrogenase [Mucor velutinosus]